MDVKLASVAILALALSGCASATHRGVGADASVTSAPPIPVSSALPLVSPGVVASVPEVRPMVTSSPTLPPGGLSAPPPVAVATPTLVSPTVLTQQPYGAVVELKVGEQVLLAPGTDWTPPTITGTSLRIVTQSGGYPSNQPMTVTILAVAPGTATIDDYTDAACFHVKPACLRPVGSLHFSVVITG
jgi:hypothetical protein